MNFFQVWLTGYVNSAQMVEQLYARTRIEWQNWRSRCTS